MNIFYKRPLSLILCVWLGGLLLFAVLPESLRPLLLLALLPLAATLAIKKFRRALPIAAASALILSLVVSFLYFGLWFRAHERFDGEVEIEAVVTEVRESSFPGAIVTLKTRNINGAPFSRYKLSATLDAEEASFVRKGSVVTLKCRLSAFVGDDSFDAESYYTSRGYSAKATDISDLTVTGKRFVLDFSRLRETISRRSIMLAGYDAGALFTALLTGDKYYLSGNLTLNFTRTGINHVLALSGTHLVILSVIVSRLLSLFKIGKKPRLLLTATLAIFYVAMTGFSSSVTRAGIMLAVACALFLLSSSQDSITALCVSVFVICTIEPYAIYDIGLWLSAFATLGVIEAGAIIGREKAKARIKGNLRAKLGFAAIASLLATLLATGATLFISVSTFASMSPMTFITTPLFSILSEIYIYLGLVMLAVGDILPFGMLMRPFYAVIDSLAEVFSKNSLACFSTTFPAVKIAAALFSVLLICFIIFKIRHKRIATGVIAVSLTAVFVTAGILTANARNVESVIYRTDESTESFVIRSDGEVCAVDISTGSVLSHYDMLDAVREVGIVELDSAIFTRYSSNLPDKVAGTLDTVWTRVVYIPRPENNKEKQFAKSVEEIAAEFDAEVKYYNEDGKITVGEVTVVQKYRVPYDEGTATTIIEIACPGGSIAYLGSGTLASAAKNTAGELISSAQTLIFGKCGKKHKPAYYFDREQENLESIILSGENLFFSQESLKFYDDQGTEVCLRPKKLELIP